MAALKKTVSVETIELGTRKTTNVKDQNLKSSLLQEMLVACSEMQGMKIELHKKLNKLLRYSNTNV